MHSEVGNLSPITVPKQTDLCNTGLESKKLTTARSLQESFGFGLLLTPLCPKTTHDICNQYDLSSTQSRQLKKAASSAGATNRTDFFNVAAGAYKVYTLYVFLRGANDHVKRSCFYYEAGT